jgi:hypothetical protein
MAEEYRVGYPIINGLQHTKEGEAALARFTKWYASSREVSVARLKRLLGPQDYCINLSKRFWAWELSGYRVQASNFKGICIEVNIPGTAPAILATDDFLQRVNKHHGE